MPLLNGKARSAYVAMCVEGSQDYMKVKQAILNKFNISTETYRQRFHSKSIKEGETAKELQAQAKGPDGEVASSRDTDQGPGV